MTDIKPTLDSIDDTLGYVTWHGGSDAATWSAEAPEAETVERQADGNWAEDCRNASPFAFTAGGMSLFLRLPCPLCTRQFATVASKEAHFELNHSRWQRFLFRLRVLARRRRR